MENAADQFLTYLEEMQESIPGRVLEEARLCLVDYLGVTARGAGQLFDRTVSYASGLGAGKEGGQIPCIGTKEKCDVLGAAFLGGFHAHALELDDGHRFGMLHLGAPIISALLCVAQKERSEGKNLLKSIVTGYEAATRLALVMQPSHKERGFHTTGTCGSVGAAIGCGVLLGLTHEQMKSALTCVASCAGGLLAVQEDDSELKPYNAGWAALAGVNAAYLGRIGFTPPSDALFGKRGMIRMLSDEEDISLLSEKTGSYEIERIYRKPYASCRHSHSAMEAARNLRLKTGIDPGEVKSIRVATYRLAIKGHDHIKVSSPSSARLSIPYCTAAAYLLEDLGPDTFSDEKIGGGAITELARVVQVEENEEFSRVSAQKRIAEVSVETFSGRTESVRVDYAKGDPENPMTPDEIKVKYDTLMRGTIYEGKKDLLYEKILSLEESAGDLYDLL